MISTYDITDRIKVKNSSRIHGAVHGFAHGSGIVDISFKAESDKVFEVSMNIEQAESMIQLIVDRIDKFRDEMSFEKFCKRYGYDAFDEDDTEAKEAFEEYKANKAIFEALEVES